MVTAQKKARVICLSNHKGGVGKTCSTSNISAGLAQKGLKVLMIDLDPQANLTLCFGIKDAKYGIYEVLTENIPVTDAIYTLYQNLDIIPSSLDLAGAEIELSSEAGREIILKEIIEVLSDKYDYIFIDCSPSIGLLTTNALTAADEVLIPLQAEYLSLRGIEKLTDVINKVKKRLNRGLEIGGVFITQFDSRKVLHRDIAQAIDDHFKELIFQTKIRDNITLAEAPGTGTDIFHYSSKSHGAEDYRLLCDEILSRHKKTK